MPSIEASDELAVCCAMLWPALLSACDELFALFFTVAPISTIACRAVLATPMLVLMLLMVSLNAEMLANCDRAAIANPSLTPMPA